ncbi:mitochondrial protein C2orf69 homolog isoform X3 [Perca flavescens]|uniref:mitochondrial protein C2orf69 homolog isoform X3 n=1 Tax=Perca flavescens TaxID=8167 RepID=UPI00106EB345|nr:UPF0565 protein C2orf69 homolog isoform X3 [Perca flavescens]
MLCFSTGIFRTLRRRWPCSQKEPSGSPGVWSRWPSPWADASLTNMFGWSEPPACISTSSAATKTLWRATCSGPRSTRPTHLTLECSTNSGSVQRVLKAPDPTTQGAGPKHGYRSGATTEERESSNPRALLSHGMERANLPNRLQPQGGADSVPPGFSLTLVGFSKGCVVLNQMVHELAGARADLQMSHFVSRVSDIYWLDGGHPGGSETWVTSKQALKELASCGVSIHAHVTPYEVCDPMRAWVGREHGHFIKTLEEFGACPRKKLHFEDEPPSIENHFRVIQEF